MRIALCSSCVPFVQGGARNIVEWLEAELRKRGHATERVYLPHVDVPDLVTAQMMAYRWVDLSGADRVICFRPPAHVIAHPRKVLWFIHHIRLFYDLWDSPYRSFPDDLRHRSLRDALHAADTAALREASAVFTNSKVVSERLRRYNGVAGEVLYPPLREPERFACAGFDDEVVCISRVEHHKRQHLLVEAMGHVRTPVKLRICGASVSPAYADGLRERVRALGLDARVTIEARWIGEDEKAARLSRCLAAAYLPLDEDSYGYSSLEAAHASKPLLTTTDSGGVLELVEHGVNGLVCEPEPAAIAQGLDALHADRRRTQAMGARARQKVDELGINWDRVVERLLA
jgi:glycosyltransferase involved in cell wall biosynthesis